ncbi:archease [Marimonas arenosa]|uniref:Archease n=1 Tax=Marimonas arenosa TaxID=1795305 RepID=A0AAE3WDU7_9RHOB|nr:archease [Marimonas arenosa]MDQ2089897.1 archease [Marimonas arenosa]
MASHGCDGKDWALYPHDADIGVRGCGDDPAEAFANAARALTSAITPLSNVAAREAVQLACSAPDLDVLFVDWLNAVIYEMSIRKMLFAGFEISIEDTALRATLRGETVDIDRHAPNVEPKGATFTGLRVAKGPDGRWVAECIVDV